MAACRKWEAIAGMRNRLPLPAAPEKRLAIITWAVVTPRLARLLRVRMAVLRIPTAVAGQGILFFDVRAVRHHVPPVPVVAMRKKQLIP